MSDEKKPKELWIDTFDLTAYDNKSQAEIDCYNIVHVIERESYSALEEKLRVAVDFLTSISKEKCADVDCRCPTHAKKCLDIIAKLKGGK